MSQAKTITLDELERLHRRLEHTRNALRNQTMLHLMHWAGMRVGEVAALRIKDLINRDGTVAQIWSKVKVPGHAAEVLVAAQAL